MACVEQEQLDFFEGEDNPNTDRLKALTHSGHCPFGFDGIENRQPNPGYDLDSR